MSLRKRKKSRGGALVNATVHSRDRLYWNLETVAALILAGVKVLNLYTAFFIS